MVFYDAAKIVTGMYTMHKGVEGADKIVIYKDGVIEANVNWLD